MELGTRIGKTQVASFVGVAKTYAVAADWFCELHVCVSAKHLYFKRFCAISHFLCKTAASVVVLG